MYCLDANSLWNHPTHCKFNDICIAWTLVHYKNNAIHCKINDICTAWMLRYCKNTAFNTKSKIYVSRAPPAGSLISPSPEAPKTTRKGHRASKTISHTYTYPHTWQFTWPPGGASGFGKISSPSCRWMTSCWRRPRQRTRLIRKCAPMLPAAPWIMWY